MACTELAQLAPPTFDVRDAGAIDGALALGLRLVAAAEAFATQFGDLGDLELPPVAGSEADQAILRTVPPLYLAAELEAARLLPAVEMLAGLFVSGGIEADLGAASPLLVAFWRKRHERFAKPERQAFFAALFGVSAGPTPPTEGGRNTEFDGLMISLTGALSAVETEPSRSQATLGVATRQLAANLIPRSGGIAGYAARDLLAAIQDALTILKETAVQQALGARGVWGAVESITRRYLREEVDLSSHVTRGKSGMLVLAWLAEALPRLESAGRLVEDGDQVIGAGQAWLEASFALSERSLTPSRAAS